MLIPKLKKNITKMKSKISWSNHFISLAVSLIFIPLALLGQIGGNVIGNLLVWFNDYIAWWNFPNFIKIITSSFISGFVAGYFSAFIILKIYKKVNDKTTRHYINCLSDVTISSHVFGDFFLKKGKTYDFVLETVGRDPILKRNNIFIAKRRVYQLLEKGILKKPKETLSYIANNI